MTRKKQQELDHPDQAIDTPVPGDDVKEDVFAAMVEEYEGDPDEVDDQAGDDDNG
jgi:hypothetical protein